ncbi:MAG: HAD family phosphatase [Hoeflea sp.]|uniref:HAD family hydrolase n=1 Tax=Hoeflea sp. TaxID=1940281 RepID=UPI001D89346E|nr:HAD family phosphatase [Hoeflea sp.]MBU4527755.1 HAD family phosphatase [Alphaproteobacteria bacterium]MBU4546210.1 HAD family phosphatase [Alphaproteobacteria bacterium]MBU4553105.1 HAD family phosphatase [Alphaproteobacteria bacterium]MBV1724177.1 HAD family phosphatase [Hoeflea sp.]MBV1759862.1 HAD family phosphatase [Hoeflea sp.]
MPGFDLIIYDCDGVLVDSEIIAAEVESKLLTESGFPISPEEMAERFAGLTWKDILLTVELESSIPFSAQLLDESERLLDIRLASDVQAIDGAMEAILRIPGPRCICSNSSLPRLKTMLARTGIDRLFGDHIYSAKDLGEGRTKPAPDVFLHGASQLGVKPSGVLVIEDSVHGIHGARAAGMRVVGFTGASHSYPGHADQLTEAGAETVISRMRDLPATVEALAGWTELL